MLLPGVGRALLVVAIDRLLVVVALVFEELAAAQLGGGSRAEQDRLVVVADLVAQMSEHGPVGLAEAHAHALAVRRIGLVEVERDHAVRVAGGDGRVAAGEQLEGEAARLLEPACDRQLQVCQLEQQPALGRLGCGEAAEAVRVGVVGARARQQAARAQLAVAIHQPVAGG